MDGKKIDWIFIILWPVFASIISLLYRVNFLNSIVLFYVLPAAYISLRNHQFIKKALYMSLACLPTLLVIDWMAVQVGTWYFPTSVFDSRLFGVTVFEQVLWLFMYIYFVVIFYEYFIDKHFVDEQIHPKFKYLTIVTTLFFVAFIISLVTTGTFIKIPHIYLVFGFIFCFIPIPLVLFRFHKLTTKIIQTTIYFATTSLLWEIVALKLNQWTFPGTHFFGWVEMFNVKFPLEELFIWIISGSAAIIIWYEYFDDDCE